MKKEIAILSGAGVIALSILGGFYMHAKINGGSDSAFVDPDSMFSGRPIAKEEYLVGEGKKKVVLVEYSDMECPFCKKLHVETMQDIYKNYSDKIDVVFRHFPLPFHKKAPIEAVATLCARDIGGQKAYRDYIEKIYETTNGNDSLDLSTLPKMATAIGLDVNTFNSCMSNASSTADKFAQVQADTQDGVEVGVQGTPNVFVLIKNGDSYNILTIINGARDYKYVSKVIDQALKQ